MVLGDSLIPAGATVILSLASLNRNPETFPNPKSFDPEHFSPSNENAKFKNVFLPFSGGPRNCIGKYDNLHNYIIAVLIELCTIV